ncbi:MAG: aminoacyl-tRNA hydrolase, partial [Bacteroidales bacterium]|nr:aminoacyl-tRNA hydrolase [Bacteroidales bacterium]
HNMGFMILDAWAKASNVVFRSARLGSVTEIQEKNNKFTLLKPSTYMNLSGKAVRHWVKKLKLPLEQLLVISDDLNLPFGQLRMRKSGSAGGHNGLTSITEMLESQDYPRLRVGIGNNFTKGGQIDFVLGDLTEEEKTMVGQIADRAIEGIKLFGASGIERAMNLVNTNPK